VIAAKALFNIGYHTAGVAVGFDHELSDNLDLTKPAPLGQDAFVDLLSAPSCESVVGHTNTLRKLRCTRHSFLPPLLKEGVTANIVGQY
jgi:hypothetical protein